MCSKCVCACVCVCACACVCVQVRASACVCVCVPRLPRKTKVVVTKCRKYHAKRRSLSPSATPTTQSKAATTAPGGNQARHHSQPRAISATPATQNEGRCHQVIPSATPAAQSDGRCHRAPRLPHRMTVDVAKCHACHANGGRDHGAKRDPSTSPEPAQCRERHTCHQNEGRYHQVPRLHRMTVDVAKRHACHANGNGDHGVKRDPSTSPEPAQCRECHACYAKRRPMSPRATPATQNDDGCRQAPRLPRKRRRRPGRQTGPKHFTRASPAPRLTRKTIVDVTKRHACHTE